MYIWVSVMYNLQKDKDKYFQLGKVIKTYGYKGELVIHLDTNNPEEYQDMDMLFLNMEGSLVPWYIDDIDLNGDLATIKLDDIISLEKAREFVGFEVYLPLKDLKQLSDNEFYFHEVIGFKAVDKEHGDIGEVVEILERTEQEIIRIMHEGKEIMVPLTDEMISSIDRKAKVLYLQTPPGLIDLYLE